MFLFSEKTHDFQLLLERPITETPPGVLCPALELSVQEIHGPAGAGPEEATKMIQGLEHLS